MTSERQQGAAPYGAGLSPESAASTSHRSRPTIRSDILNIPEGVVALSYPEQFSEESYLDIEAWLNFEMAKLKRWAALLHRHDHASQPLASQQGEGER